MARVIQVIETEIRRGTGRDENSPIRGVMQYFRFDGIMLAEHDPICGKEGQGEIKQLRAALQRIADDDPSGKWGRWARDALT